MDRHTKKRRRQVVVLLLLLFLALAAVEAAMASSNVSSSGPRGEEEEEGMEMEGGGRRALWEGMVKGYISYGALRKDVVPCTRPGVAYYHCRSLPSASPFSRGCEIITDCSRDLAAP